MNTHALVQLGQKAVYMKDNKCLILHSSGKDMWDLPGGRLHELEEPRDGLTRELYEEIGLREFESIAVLDYDVWLPNNGKRPICLIATLITSKEEAITLSDEHDKYKWIRKNEVSHYKFFSPVMTRMIIKGYEHLEKN